MMMSQAHKANQMYRLLILFLFTASLSGCSSFSKVPEWLIADEYKLPPAELVEFSLEFEPEVVWSEDTGSGVDGDYSNLSPWLQGDSIYTVDHEGEVHSYTYKTGQLIWQIELEVPVATGVGGGEGLILVGTSDGEVIALDESTGVFKWRKRLTSEVLAPPKANMGIVVARTSDGRMTGLSAEDGSVLWNYQRTVPLLSLRGASEPIIANDKVIAGYDSGKIVALSLYDGKVIWEQSVAVSRGRTEIDRLVDIDSAPVIRYGIIYVVAYHGRLVALDLDTGREYWAREMSSRSGLDVAPNTAVYVSDESSYVWAIQDASGDSLWRQTSLLRRKVTAPAVVGNNVLVGDFEGYLHWLARDNGRFVARTRISKTPIRSKPIVTDDLVFVRAIDGTLTALRVQ
jgi:outer membrane protein assembly factor BamB